MSPSPLCATPSGARLRRQRHDDAQDDVRARADPERHDRLDVEQRAGGVAVADAEVPVALKRHADQARDRVLRLLSRVSWGQPGRPGRGCLSGGRDRQRQHHRQDAQRTRLGVTRGHCSSCACPDSGRGATSSTVDGQARRRGTCRGPTPPRNGLLVVVVSAGIDGQGLDRVAGNFLKRNAGEDVLDDVQAGGLLLVVGADECTTGAMRVSVVGQHAVAGARVVVPAGPRRKVHRTELPLPDRIVDARLEAPLLLLVADFEPQLDQDDAAADEIAFELRAQVEEALVLLSEQKPMTCSTPARLYQLRSKMTISPAAGKCCRYRCM